MEEQRTSAVGAGSVLFVEFMKKQMEIFRQLARKPFCHDEVRQFVFSLLELVNLSGFSFENFGTGSQELSWLLRSAYLKTQVEMGNRAYNKDLFYNVELAENIMQKIEELANKGQGVLLDFYKAELAAGRALDGLSTASPQ